LTAKGAVYGLGSSINGLLGFVLIPFYLHQLHAAEYGRYALAETCINLLCVVLGLGLSVALLVAYPQTPSDERPRLFGEVLAFVLVSTAVMEALFLAAYGILRAGHLLETEPRQAILVAAISAVETVWMLFATWYRAEGAAWRYIGASFVQLAVGLVATILLILVGGMREDGILVGRLIGDVATLGVVIAVRANRFPLRLRPRAVLPVLRIGIPLIPATFANLWMLMSPRVFIDWFGSKADVGVFTMSAKIAGLLSLLFVQPFGMAWMVSLFRVVELPSARHVYGRVVTYYVLAAGMLAFTLGLASYAVVPLITRSEFPLAPGIVLVMALATVVSGLMYSVNIGPYVTGQTATQTRVFVAAAVVTTLSGFVGTLAWGAAGAAIGLLIGFAFQAAALARLSQRLYPIDFEATRLVKVVVALGLGVAAAGLVRRLVPPPLGDWLLAPVFLAGASALLFGLGFPLPGELSALRGIVARVARPGRP
jgi:O-antigen/teichoic acid export membrane protein